MAHEIKDTADDNNRLYSDLHYSFVKSKKENRLEAANAMRNLIRQAGFHCMNLKISETGSKPFKRELLADYYELVDGEEHSELLPVCSHSPKKLTGDDYQKLNRHVKELSLYLDSLKIRDRFQKATPVSTASTSHFNVVQPQPALPNNKNISMEKSLKQSTFNFPNKALNSGHFKPTNLGIINKRPLDVDEPNLKNPAHAPKKPYRWCGNQKSCVQAMNSSAKQPPGFMTASSMYRNPLKKANQDAEESDNQSEMTGKTHESLKHFEKKIVDVIFNEIMDFSPDVKWSDIAGLEFVKTTVQEIVIWPLLRPDIFTGLRAPPRGILLFGPPGTGKTLIGKCIATESNSTFFCISASSLASKWVGESEQLVRALFTVANLNQPAVIFIDEIDSLLSQRSDKEQDFSRKLKTEFLVQFDGAKTSSESRVLVVGATNRPEELDEAARRRFVKRLYVPLPETSGRRQIIEKLLASHEHNLTESDFQRVCDETKGYSASDVTHLCKEAAMGPIRSIGPLNIKTVSLDQVRPIKLEDFLQALHQVRASVAQDDLDHFLDWNKKFGSFSVEKI